MASTSGPEITTTVGPRCSQFLSKAKRVSGCASPPDPRQRYHTHTCIGHNEGIKPHHAVYIRVLQKRLSVSITMLIQGLVNLKL